MFSTLPPAAGVAAVDKGDAHRDRAALRSRKLAKSAAEIGLPPKRNEKLWKRYQFNLFAFLQERFPHSTGKGPFSPEHKDIIEKTQDAILWGGLELVIMFRGGSKSTITEGAAIWGTNYGHRRFFVPIGATDEAAQQALDSIQMELETNDLLMEIFPAACHAARALEGVPQRAGKQTMGGVRTLIEWTTKRCVLPTFEGFEGSGAIIWPRSITAQGLRGTRFKRPDGEQARPDFVLLDDPQTDESAASDSQNDKRMKTVKKTILRMNGHESPIAAVCNATPIEPDDMVHRLMVDPAWRVSKVPMLKSFPKHFETEWLGVYAELRTTYEGSSKDAKRKAHQKATAYYKANRKRMDEGGEATWKECFDKKNEISAIQHAVNILLEIGYEAFMAECQVAPLVERTGLERLTLDELCRKQSAYERGVIPPACSTLVAKIDVHPSILYATLWAFEDNFTGYLVDWSTFPDQKRPYFTHTGASHRLEKLFPKRDLDATITAGLAQYLHGDEAAPGLMHRAWRKPIIDGESAGSLKISRLAIDANGQANKAVNAFILNSPFRELMYPEFGKGVRCKHAPMSKSPEARKQPKNGPEWIDTKGQPRGSMFDTNYWKTRFWRGLALPEGSQGALYLFKTKRPEDHRMFAEHCLAEPVKEVTIGNRTVHEFDDPKAGESNHLFDCSVGCMVAASRAGVTNLRSETRKPSRGRRKVKYADDF